MCYTRVVIFVVFNFRCNNLTMQMAKERNHGNYSVTETVTSTWLKRIKWYYHCWGTSSGGMMGLLPFSSVMMILQRIPIFLPRRTEWAQNNSQVCRHIFLFLFFSQQNYIMKKMQRSSNNIILLLQNHNLHCRKYHSAREELTGRGATFSV